ncbi:hypothetical protein BD779DRAFT_1158075 [Infundibulicybe gibba]|nr:hypothetical protein BD779DRAFT_1158075 [Infundibulicybe gibba]
MFFATIFGAAIALLTPPAHHLETRLAPAGPSATCAKLQAALGPVIVTLRQAQTEEYDAAVGGAWNLFNTQFQPACVVLPHDASHVQEAMRAIYRDQVHYAVQAGSHSAMKGWNNVQDGVLITFSHMRNVSFDAKDDSITLQPGIHWGEAISKLEPLGVAPVGGRVSDVGTGLLLGGGLSFLAPEHGFSADTIRELDVVLVTGDIVTATPTNKYADLFRALKGGANRFGIVTRYKVDAVHTGTNADKNWFGGTVTYPNSSAEAVVDATARYVRNVTDPKAAILVVLINIIVGGVVSTTHFANLFYHGTELPNSIFGEFLSIPGANTTSLGPLSYVEVSNALGPGDDRGSGQLFGASALASHEDLSRYQGALRHWENFTESVKTTGDVFVAVLAFTPVLESQIRIGPGRGGNAIDPPAGGYVALQFQMQMAAGVSSVSPEIEAARQLVFTQVPRSPGIPLYVNECDRKQNVFETYGGYEFLKRTYQKYDPSRFNVRFTDGPMGL